MRWDLRIPGHYFACLVGEACSEDGSKTGDADKSESDDNGRGEEHDDVPLRKLR